MQSEGIGHHGWEGMEANVTGADVTGTWAVSYPASTVRKQFEGTGHHGWGSVAAKVARADVTGTWALATQHPQSGSRDECGCSAHCPTASVIQSGPTAHAWDDATHIS